MRELYYWIKFDKADRPYKIVAKNFEDLLQQVKKMTFDMGEPFEWLNRDYR